jgi:hypothetical protein
VTAEIEILPRTWGVGNIITLIAMGVARDTIKSIDPKSMSSTTTSKRNIIPRNQWLQVCRPVLNVSRFLVLKK